MPDVCNFCGNSGDRSKPCGVCKSLRAKDWRETYPERHRLYNDLKRAQTPTLPEEEKRQVLAAYAMARYKTEETGIEYHVDHIVPISRGGLHKPDNLRVITAKENLMKGAKILTGVEVVQATTEQDQVTPPND